MTTDDMWERRQQLLGLLFERNDSVDFSTAEKNDNEETRKKRSYKHDVYHISANKDIIIMRIANNTSKEVVQDFKKKEIAHEPPCYVIIDNRLNCRRIAIQKKGEAFNSTSQVQKIIQKVLDNGMRKNYFIGIELLPQYYPLDFYKTWRLHENATNRLRFNVGSVDLPRESYQKLCDDDTLTGWAIAMNEETTSHYSTTIELNPPADQLTLPVDESTTFVKNLVNYSAATGSSIEIITRDGSRFTCYINKDEESDKVVTSSIDEEFLDILFTDNEYMDIEKRQKYVAIAEEKIVEFVNHMKVSAKEENGQEKIAC